MAILAAGTWIQPVSGQISNADGKRPNIVFIMVDDLGKDWINCYGADNIKTPHIDKLAADGVKFHNAWSMPQCTPTRATLLTGQYPFRTGWVNHWDVPRWGVGYFDWKLNKSFSQELNNAGYATAIAGKWQINDFRLEPEAMKKHGFDDWCLWTGYETGVKASAERYWDPYIHTRSGSKTYNGAFGPDIYNQFLVDFVKKNKERPWMVYYPMALTHGPLVTTPDDPEVSGKLPRFRAMVRYMDKLVGQLVKAIDDSGQADNTMIIFTTDNGSPGVLGTIDGVRPSGGKASRFEGGVCQPFVARWPGKISPASESHALIDFSDLFPTFLDLAGVSYPENHFLDGQSFASILKGQSLTGKREWILSMGHGPAARDKTGVRGILDYAPRVIRDQTYKFWIDSNRSIAAIYNLHEDPLEKVNILDNPAKLTLLPPDVMDKFKKVIDSMPTHDGRPKYRDRATNTWDKRINFKPRN